MLQSRSAVQDQRVSTEDLLFLLASFGRDAPTSLCAIPAPSPPVEVVNLNTFEEAREQRTYLLCALRDRFFGEVSRVQTVFDTQMETCNSTVQQLEQQMVEDSLEAQQAAFDAMAEAAAMAATIGNLTASISAAEQRMRTLHCPIPVLQHTEIVAGDPVYGGEGIRLQCTPGYADDGKRPFHGFVFCVPHRSGRAPDATDCGPCRVRLWCVVQVRS